MGCCNPKSNKVDDVNETAIRKIEVGENKSSNEKLKSVTKKPVSNESEISLENTDSSSNSTPRSLGRQKEASISSKKSFFGSENQKEDNQSDYSNNQTIEGSGNENKSNTESDDDSTIESESDNENNQSDYSNKQTIKGSDNEQENIPNSESDNDLSIAVESEPENRQNINSDNASIVGSNNDSESDELSDYDEENHKNESIKPIKNRDLSLEDVDEWKSLIETLTSNSKLMSYALAKRRTDFMLVSEVGNYLATCREAKSVTEKAWLVYVWVTHNIAYDVVSLRKNDYRFWRPQDVLSRGLAVCAGYAELYKALCEHLGIECIKISGYSKGAGYKVGQKVTEESHAWNAIALGSDGKLRFIESTWGAGHLFQNREFKKEFVPHYFAVPAHIFNETHHSESYTPSDGTKKFTLDEFDDCANNKLGYHVLGLTCVNNTMRAITRTNKNPLVIEYTAPQKIYFSTTLLDERTNREITNSVVVQSEYAIFKDQKSKYCLIADIPEKGRTYKLQLFAKNKNSSEDEDQTFPMITEFLVVREGDEESYIPQYNLTFAHGIKLNSHYCQFIKFKTNPLVMEFEVPKHIKTLFSVKTLDDIKIEDAVSSQINPENSKTIVQVAIPRRGEKFLLQVFAKHVRDQGNSFGFVSQVFLIRTQSNPNDSLSFCKVFTRGQDCFIYSPIEYYLTSNSLYEFRYFINDALDVAFVDSSKKWIHLDRLNQDPNVWVLNTALTNRGNLTLYAKFDEKNSFDGICYYEVK